MGYRGRKPEVCQDLVGDEDSKIDRLLYWWLKVLVKFWLNESKKKYMAPGAKKGHIPKPDMKMQREMISVLSMLDSKSEDKTLYPKRYALYCGKECQGGQHDFHKSSDSYQELVNEVLNLDREGLISWWEIVDRTVEKVLDSSGT